MKDYKLEERTCHCCPCKFKVLADSDQKYCSTNCMIRDNKLTGMEKLRLNGWIKGNPEKTRKQ